MYCVFGLIIVPSSTVQSGLVFGEFLDSTNRQTDLTMALSQERLRFE